MVTSEEHVNREYHYGRLWWMPLLFAEGVLQPSLLLQRPRVRGSVCQMAQQAGRPAARGAQEEIRAAGGGMEEGGGCCHFKVCAPLSWSARLCNSYYHKR